MKKTAGIHHITAIVGHPRVNVDFYANILGLRLVKKTVNFDDPETYHLYFGNEKGEPGTIITFLPWMEARKGKISNGQVGTISFSVPLDTFYFWEDRLTKQGINFTKSVRFNEELLEFTDPDGVRIELVQRKTTLPNVWLHEEISQAFAITGIAGATLHSFHVEGTEEVLSDILGFKKIDEADGIVRYASAGKIGNIIDVTTLSGETDFMGRGTGHHIAFRAKNNTDLQNWKNHIESHGLPVTEIRDHHYFKSIFFREVGGILFEIATDSPGFTQDEKIDTLGEQLMLPPHLESNRAQLEQTLPKI